MDVLHLAREAWKDFREFFPKEKKQKKRGVGRPKANPRRIFLGICYVLWTGCPWRAVPSVFGKKSTLFDYFQKWAENKLFYCFWRKWAERLRSQNRLKLETQVIDSSELAVEFMPKKLAFLSLKYKPKRTLKLSFVIEDNGLPLGFTLATSNVHDSQLLEKTLASKVVRNKKYLKSRLLGDKAYTGPKPAQVTKRKGYIPLFCPRYYHRHLLKPWQRRFIRNHRFKVERSISWIKKYRRLKLCWEKSYKSFVAFVELACALTLFKRAYL